MYTIVINTVLFIHHEKNSSVISDTTFEVKNMTIDQYFTCVVTFFTLFSDLRTMANVLLNLDNDVNCCNFFNKVRIE